MSDATALPSPQRTLLIVDDQPTVLAAIAYYLEFCGYRTLRADSGQAALDLFRKESVDGVLLDVQMPKLNGFQTGAQLHDLARETGRQIKIWFMTGIRYRELRDDCAKAGGLSVFHKPFNWPQLLAELDQGLSPPPRLAQQSVDSAPTAV